MVETPQIYINRWMDKQNVDILTYATMRTTWKHVKWNMPITKGKILYDSTTLTSRIGKFIESRV